MVDFSVRAPSSRRFSPKTKQDDQKLVDLVRRLRPTEPLHILYPDRLSARAKEFIRGFSGGTVMYAVKCNPNPDVIKTLAQAGITTFDAASIEEVRLVRRLAPHATIHFMHTVKSREAIREAYFQHGVRVFVVDTQDELRKILAETNLAHDLTIFIRLALPKNKKAATDFSIKFGAHTQDAVALLRDARVVARKLGVMFHPGTQSSDASAFVRGIAHAGKIIRTAGVAVEALDVGGGFPAPYPGRKIMPLHAYMSAIASAVAAEKLGDLELFCEPGRALVAEAADLVVRVELVRGDALYLNDGLYGGMIEMTPALGSFVYPLTHVPKDPRMSGVGSVPMPFRFCGPTCDSYDMITGPFFLPGTIAEGDWIVLSMTGAYSQSCRTHFNGFGAKHMVYRGE